MKYVSIDIETTGLDFQKCDIIQFAAVIDDLSEREPIKELPKLNVYFTKDHYVGEPIALSMHSDIFKKIALARKNKVEYDEVSESHFANIEDLPSIFRNFLTKNGIEENIRTGAIVINVAGKNIGGFDIPFLKEKIKDWEQVYFRQRVLDPSILYMNIETDKEIPDSKTCMERAGIKGAVSHTALEDAMVIVELIRYKF
jgi:DNA polymerase III epsilon subunit-like protein